ncbi:MAG: DUF3006 domain-containing protein [bacterium]|nr:DUF3006 domain-containing protein [bacterium]
MQVTVDRFEENMAVLELASGDTMRIPRAELPDETHEGDTIEVTFGINPAETDRRTQQAKDVLNELLGGDEKG